LRKSGTGGKTRILEKNANSVWNGVEKRKEEGGVTRCNIRVYFLDQ